MPPLTITRNQLATFLGNHELIKKFEELFSAVNEITGTAGDEVEISIGNTLAKANLSLSEIARIFDIIIDLKQADRVSDKTIESVAVSTVITENLFYTYEVDASGGNRTITLPSLAVAYDSNLKTGWVINVAKTDSSTNTVTIAGTINGVTDFDLLRQDESLMFQAGPTSWRAMS